MATYKRRREDDDTFGFGRYPKRSRRDCNGYSRDYHSVSVSCLKQDHSIRHVNGKFPINDVNLYHYSLSSELYCRHSGSKSESQRYSACSNASQRKRQRQPQIPDGEINRTKVLKSDTRCTDSNKVSLLIKYLVNRIIVSTIMLCKTFCNE